MDEEVGSIPSCGSSTGEELSIWASVADVRDDPSSLERVNSPDHMGPSARPMDRLSIAGGFERIMDKSDLDRNTPFD